MTVKNLQPIFNHDNDAYRIALLKPNEHLVPSVLLQIVFEGFLPRITAVDVSKSYHSFSNWCDQNGGHVLRPVHYGEISYEKVPGCGIAFVDIPQSRLSEFEQALKEEFPVRYTKPLEEFTWVHGKEDGGEYWKIMPVYLRERRGEQNPSLRQLVQP